MSSTTLPSGWVILVSILTLSEALASLAGSAPAGKLFPTPKNRMVGAGMKKSTTTGRVAVELLVMVRDRLPPATKAFGGRELGKKKPLTPTPKTPKLSPAEEANAWVWLVGTLGKGIVSPPARTKASAFTRSPMPKAALL